MIDQIFTVYDEKAKAHLPPWVMHRNDMAIRTFTDCINSSEHTFSHHPEDYTLFHHGSFENENAEFSLMAAPKPLGNGVQFINSSDQDEQNAQNRNDSPVRHDAKGRHTA